MHNRLHNTPSVLRWPGYNEMVEWDLAERGYGHLHGVLHNEARKTRLPHGKLNVVVCCGVG